MLIHAAAGGVGLAAVAARAAARAPRCSPPPAARPSGTTCGRWASTHVLDSRSLGLRRRACWRRPAARRGRRAQLADRRLHPGEPLRRSRRRPVHRDRQGGHLRRRARSARSPRPSTTTPSTSPSCARPSRSSSSERLRGRRRRSARRRAARRSRRAVRRPATRRPRSGTWRRPGTSARSCSRCRQPEPRSARVPRRRRDLPGHRRVSARWACRSRAGWSTGARATWCSSGRSAGDGDARRCAADCPPDADGRRRGAADVSARRRRRAAAGRDRRAGCRRCAASCTRPACSTTASLAQPEWPRFAARAGPEGRRRAGTCTRSPRATAGLLRPLLVGRRRCSARPGQANYAAANAFLDALAAPPARRGPARRPRSTGARGRSGHGRTRERARRRARRPAGSRLVAAEDGASEAARAGARRRASRSSPSCRWTGGRSSSGRTGRDATAPLLVETCVERRQRQAGPPADRRRATLRRRAGARRPHATAHALVRTYRRARGRVLGLDRADGRRHRQRLAGELGIDSLMACELEQPARTHGWDGRCPATLLFDYPTLEALAELHPRRARSRAGAAAARAPSADGDTARAGRARAARRTRTRRRRARRARSRAADRSGPGVAVTATERPPDRADAAPARARRARAAHARRSTTSKRGANEPIAIVGMGCRFPGGADEPATLWELLRDGPRRRHRGAARRAGTSTRYYDPDPEAPGKMLPRCGGVPRRRRPLRRRVLRHLAARGRRAWTRSSACCSRWRGRRSSTPAARPTRLAGSATGVFVGISDQRLRSSVREVQRRRTEHRRLRRHRQRAQRRRRPAVLRARPAGAEPWRSTPPARRRWSRCTWRARACAPASASWRWPAAST